ncbi:conserved hypothetical protein [Tenacibaculum sp. 190524A02b]|uniref:Uncharacterized protein n=1 Tax=Tenacibaculum vairaonense TaxID=3137860 RepID=A0ABP1FC47_9FLAO
MNKLSFNDFKAKANLTTDENLLNTISGGTENACHDKKTTTIPLQPIPSPEPDGTKVYHWWLGY